MIQNIVKSIQEKKGQHINVFDLTALPVAVADYFVLCSAQSAPQVEAIADQVIEECNKVASQKPWRKEGFANKEWIILDYGAIVVHIFQEEKRALYALDELWGDAMTTCF